MNGFEQKYRIELSDITPKFKAKSTIVLKYFQETFARYCKEHNATGYDLYQLGLKWVLGQTILNFFDIIPEWNEELTATVCITNVKKLRIYIDFEIKTERGLVAQGQTIAFILDWETSRPKPVKMIADKFELNENDLDGEILNADFNQTGEFVSAHEHTITFSDLDYNNHTNNISYISLALEGSPNQCMIDTYPSRLEIRYLQETFLKDTLKCVINKNNNCCIYNIVNSQTNKDVCTINSYKKITE